MESGRTLVADLLPIKTFFGESEMASIANKYLKKLAVLYLLCSSRLLELNFVKLLDYPLGYINFYLFIQMSLLFYIRVVWVYMLVKGRITLPTLPTSIHRSKCVLLSCIPSHKLLHYSTFLHHARLYPH